MKRFPEWYKEKRGLLGKIANFWLLPSKLKTILNALLDAFDAILIAGNESGLAPSGIDAPISLNDVWVKE